MIIKASDMLAVGGLDDNAVFYDDKTQVFYLGKSLKTVDVKQMGLTGVQVILLYNLMKWFASSIVSSGVLVLLIGLLLSFLSSKWFVHKIWGWQYEVRKHDFSSQEITAFLNSQRQKHRPLYALFGIVVILLILASVFFLITKQGLWLFMTLGLSWSFFTGVQFFGKIISNVRGFQKGLRIKNEKILTYWERCSTEKW